MLLNCQPQLFQPCLPVCCCSHSLPASTASTRTSSQQEAVTLQVFANDLNPDSFEYLQRNIKLNRVQGKVQASKMDGRAFLRRLCGGCTSSPAAEAASEPAGPSAVTHPAQLQGKSADKLITWAFLPTTAQPVCTPFA